MDKNEKLKEIFQNESFKAEVQVLTETGCSSARDLQELLSKYGLDLTEQEVITLCSQIATYSEGELSEEALANVSGGGFLFVAGCIALGVGAIGCLAIGIYNGYRSGGK